MLNEYPVLIFKISQKIKCDILMKHCSFYWDTHCMILVDTKKNCAAISLDGAAINAEIYKEFVGILSLSHNQSSKYKYMST